MMTTRSPEQRPVQRVLLRAINFYQVGRQDRPSPCRFTPTCSEYSREAVETFGAGRGAWLTIRRLLRCRPFGPSGFDPVPEPSVPTASTISHSSSDSIGRSH